MTDDPEVASGAMPPPDFRRLFESAADLYMVFTPSLQIVAFSDAYCRATMIQREHALGRHLFDVFPDNPDDPAANGVRNLRASIARALQYRRPDPMPVQKYDVRRPDARGRIQGGAFELRYWACVNTPIFNDAGEVAWILHRAEDVTEQVQLREMDTAHRDYARRQQQVIDQLTSTKRFLDAVVDNLPNMLFVKSYPDCRFVLFNRAGEKLLGYPSEAFLGKTDYDFFPKDQADHFVRNDRRILETGIPELISEEPVETRHHGTRILRTIKVPVQDEQGRPEYLLGLSEDITDKKLLEGQLRQAVKMEAVGQLTGGIAHDFNNLLGIVVGNLDLAQERITDPALRELIVDALNGALHGAELTRRLLAFSRNQPLQPAIVDLNRSLPQMAAMLRRTIGETIEVELHPAEDLWPAFIDSAQVDEAVLNLAINARDAMPRGGKLTIETGNAILDADYAARHAEVTPGDYVQLTVSDTGIGMSPEVIERCFEPFFTTKEVEKGTGLGLSMVYGFVKQSGGHIKIYSELGHGTSVKLYLPRANRDARTQAPAMAVAVPVAGGERVLVVEDNADLRAVSVMQLADLGYRTYEAGNARDALEMLSTYPDIRVLFSDIVMPGGMTGTELAREARRRHPHLRVLLTTGYAARAAANGFHDIGGLDLLLKPFRKADLGRKLRELLAQPGGSGD